MPCFSYFPPSYFLPPFFPACLPVFLSSFPSMWTILLCLGHFLLCEKYMSLNTSVIPREDRSSHHKNTWGLRCIRGFNLTLSGKCSLGPMAALFKMLFCLSLFGQAHMIEFPLVKCVLHTLQLKCGWAQDCGAPVGHLAQFGGLGKGSFLGKRSFIYTESETMSRVSRWGWVERHSKQKGSLHRGTEVGKNIVGLGKCQEKGRREFRLEGEAGVRPSLDVAWHSIQHLEFQLDQPWKQRTHKRVSASGRSRKTGFGQFRTLYIGQRSSWGMRFPIKCLSHLTTAHIK